MFLDIRYTDEQMGLIYNNYRDEEYISIREAYETEYRTINGFMDKQVPYMKEIENMIEPHISKFPVSILDYGGDTGINAPFSNRRLDVYDIGTNQVIDGAVKIDKITDKYDLVVCANVLEHVPYPLDILTEITEYMNGLLYIEVPIDGFPYSGWHEHVNLFSGKGVEIMLDRCGLEIIDKKSFTAEITPGIVELKQIGILVKRKDKL